MIGLVLVHALGAMVSAAVDRRAIVDTLSSPASFFVGLIVLFSAALGLPGIALLAVLALGVWLSPRELEATPRATAAFGLTLAALVAWTLARPWVPLFWDEFVWLAKARLGHAGFSGVIDASLDPTMALIPTGYVPLWPAAVGWLSLGTDSIETHVLAASLLVVACAAVALEAWWEELAAARGWALVIVLSAPLVLVHLKSNYVDLPVGLLGLALLGRLLHGRAGLGSLCLAIALAAFKDEGATQVLSASVATVVVTGLRESWRRLGPLLAAFVTFALWRVLLVQHGVEVRDHALNAPAWGWLSSFARLLLLHAGDVLTWGVTWAVVLGVVVRRASDRQSRALRWMLAGNVLLMTTALVFGPERVRVFAENGTLLNRLLLQSWPAAAMLLVAATVRVPEGPALTDRAA
ncbi:MAG: hypothetical protein U0228_01670 [Myxococcaceae bacterium]